MTNGKNKERSSWWPLFGGRLRANGSEYRRIAIQLHYDLLESGQVQSLLLVPVNDRQACARSSMLLARCAAEELGRTVLLVDGCLADPVVSRMTGGEGRPGLTEALAEPAKPLADLVLPTDHESVHVLTAGLKGPRAASPERLAAFIQAAEAQYGLVVVSGGAVFEEDCTALALTPHAGCVLLTAVEGSTKVTELEAAQEALARCRPKRLGLLLTAPIRGRKPAVRVQPAAGSAR